MSLDKATVRRIAHLARIRVEEDRLEPLAGELNAILGWIEQLNEVDTSGLEPLASVAGHGLPMREDKVGDGGDPDLVLAGAPDRAGDFYAAPKAVE